MLSFFANVTPHRQAQSNLVQVSSKNPDPQALQTFRNWQDRRNQLQKSVQSLKSEFLRNWIPGTFLPQLLIYPMPVQVDLTGSTRLKNPGDGWETNGFGDAEWLVGKSGFGLRGTPGSIVHTEWKTKGCLATPQIWFGRVAQVALSLFSSR